MMAENKEYMYGMQQIRRSNAAGKHADKRRKRARTRQAALLKALKQAENNR